MSEQTDATAEPVETPEIVPTPAKEKTVRVNLHLRASVHTKLRMWCLKNRYTLQAGLEEIVEHAMGMGK